ncbi:MAG TPA: hypothetical protein VFV38_23330, partial [Ktedonobacteraceae bacterium]|nr:hypothetical protein [Ktedonobacteraceae bacterium]
MEKFIFTEKEIVDIQLLLKEVSSRYQTVEEVEFLMDAPIYAHELPRRLRAFLNRFKQNEDISGACVVSGYPVDQQKIGKTPHHWKVRGEPSPCLEEEIFLLLCGNLLGEPFGWSTQQNGYILNNVVPIKEHETEQLGSGSKETL